MKLPKAETDAQQMENYSKQLNYWNTEMNNILNKLQQALPKSEVAQLQTGQQEWVYNNNADAGFTQNRCYELIVTYM